MLEVGERTDGDGPVHNEGTAAIRLRRKLAAAAAAFGTLGVAGPSSAQQVVYVDDDAPAGGDGLSWATALRSIGEATELLSGSGGPVLANLIRVAQGVYPPSIGPVASGNEWIVLQSGTAIQGGFRGLAGGGNPSDRSPALFPTVIDGTHGLQPQVAGAPTGVEIRGVGRLDGLTIRGTRSSFVHMSDFATLEAVDCTFEDPATRLLRGIDGRHVGSVTLLRCGLRDAAYDLSLVRFESGADMRIEDCAFEGTLDATNASLHFTNFTSVEVIDSTFTRMGGDRRSVLWISRTPRVGLSGLVISQAGTGVYPASEAVVSISSATLPVIIEHCRFVGNVAQGAGSASVLEVHSVFGGMLRNCHFEGNTSDEGPPVVLWQPGFFTVENCLFARNSSFWGPGAIRVDGDADIRNCTIVDNHVELPGVAAIRTPVYNETWVSNSIVWGNTSGSVPATLQSQIDPPVLSRISDSIVTGIAGGLGNLAANPGFAGPIDYRLAAGSPAINLGWNPAFAAIVGTDLDGGPRVSGGFVDAGCYEAMVASGCGGADMALTATRGLSGYRIPDGTLGSNDFFVYLEAWVRGDAAADMTSTAVPGMPGYGVPNGLLSNDDFFYYLLLYQQGC